jgi:hypothetical protein
MSVRELASALPEPEVLRERSVVLAALDAILSDSWESRWYSYDPQWGDHEQLASMRNGSGDEYSVVFSGGGVFVRGFDHESLLSPYRRTPRAVWPGVLEGIPEHFLEFVNEPSFSEGSGTPLITVCLWRSPGESRWQHGDVKHPEGGTNLDGSDWLFGQLADGTAQSYVEWAVDYFEVELRPEDVAPVFSRTPLTAEIVARIAPDRDWEEVSDELRQIGYPIDPQ